MLPSSSAGSRRSAVQLRAPSPGSAVMQHAPYVSGCSNFPNRVLLDTVAHMGRCRDNATTAVGKTSDGCDIEISFMVADPPSLTRCVVDCSHLTSGVFFENPPLITGADGAFLLLIVTFPKSRDLFVYKSGPGTPSLEVLPRPYPIGYQYKYVGVLSCGDHCLLVIPNQRPDGNLLSFDLHVFSTKTKTKSWSTKVVSLDCGVTPPGCWFRFNRAFALGGGSIAWVDHWNGILLCDAVDGDRPKASLIQLPRLMPVNAYLGVDFDGLMPCLDRFRDVTFSRNDGCFRFIEVGFPKVGARRRQLNFGGTAAMSKMKIGPDNSDEWEPCGTVNFAILSPAFPYVLPVICKEKFALNNMICSFPTLDPYHENVLYMTVKMKADDSDGWIVAINTKTKTILKLAPFTSETLHLHRTYMLCEFFKHLASGAGSSIGWRSSWKHDISMEAPLVLYVISVLLVQQKFRQFEKYFTKERPSLIKIWSLLHIGVSSAMNVHIHQVVHYAAKMGRRKAACDAVDTFQRALKDVGHLLQRYCWSDPSVCREAVGDQINVAVGALDKLLHMLPSRMLYSVRSLVSVDEYNGISVSGLGESFDEKRMINAVPSLIEV